MDLTAVRKALAAACEAVNTATQPMTCLPYVPSRVVPPTLYVQPARTEFDKTMARGMDAQMFTVSVVVAKADDEASQDLLDLYLAGSGPLSVKAAIEAARGVPGQLALGGAADDLHVQSVDAYRWFTFGETQYLGAQFAVRVIGSGV